MSPLVLAYLYGHAWNPNVPNLQNLDMGRVLKMDGSETDAKELLRSWQQSDYEYDYLTQLYLKRKPDYDGEVGPATRAFMEVPRCPIPDFAPPKNASFHYDDPELQAAVESYQQFAEAQVAGGNIGYVNRDLNTQPYIGGSGSWPKGCDPQNPNVHSVIVAIDSNNASAHQKETLAECLKMVEACEAAVGQSVRHVVNGGSAGAQHDVKFQSIAGSTIGFAYFPTPNTCNQKVTARLDNGFNPRATILAELYVHEYKGHSDGLQHTRGGIMHPSIGSPQVPPTWDNDPSYATKKRYFGGVGLVPQGPTDPPTPTPPVGAKVSIRNSPGLTYGREVVALQNFVATKGDILLETIEVPR
jgi:hypothetical protein